MSLRLLVALILLLMPSLLVGQQPTAEPPTSSAFDTKTELIRRLLDVIRLEMDQKQLPGFAIGLADGRRDLTFTAGFGFSDAQLTQRIDERSVFRVGSVSKLLTDIAVMQLVENGEIALDQDLRPLLLEVVPQGKGRPPISLRQLMSHRSGLVREPPVGNYFDASEPTLADTVRSLRETEFVYPPGTRTKYSNAGIAVVGYLIEALKGQSFSQYMKQQVLGPIGMSSSDFQRTANIDSHLATGWMWTYDGQRFPAPDFALGTIPAGNLYSTVGDLCRFLHVIFDDGRMDTGRLLSTETLQTMMTPGNDPGGDSNPFALGFHIQQLDEHRMVGHGGAVYGFSTQLEALPDEQLGVVAVSTLDGSNGVVRRIAEYALRLMLAEGNGEALPEYTSTTEIPANRARQLVGTYTSNDSRVMVQQDNDRLLMRRGAFEMRLRDAHGQVVVDDPLVGLGTSISLDTENQLQIGPTTYVRAPDICPPSPPVRWVGLIGEYGWDHNTLYILEDQGQLHALIEWFYYYPLRELGNNVFAFPDDGLYHGEVLTFQRGSDGRATKVNVGPVAFPRRRVGPEEGETFRITPLRPIDQLRAAARNADPPNEDGPKRASDLVELVRLDPTLKLDVRYASDNNFMGSVFYARPRAFLQRPAAQALVSVHRRLQKKGYGLLIHDAYRPWYVTKMFWDATPAELKDFVANPAAGSRHNRGCAVDLTLYDTQTGQPVPMVAGYDEFSTRSYPRYPGGTERQRWHRQLLRQAMEAAGFSIYEYEWWHFDYRDWQQYPIMNWTFEQIAPSP